jgi:hypothetical protein
MHPTEDWRHSEDDEDRGDAKEDRYHGRQPIPEGKDCGHTIGAISDNLKCARPLPTRDGFRNSTTPAIPASPISAAPARRSGAGTLCS